MSDYERLRQERDYLLNALSQTGHAAQYSGYTVQQVGELADAYLREYQNSTWETPDGTGTDGCAPNQG